MARYVMILRSAIALRGALEGVGPENRDLFASAIWAQKRFSGHWGTLVVLCTRVLLCAVVYCCCVLLSVVGCPCVLCVVGC